VRRTPADLELLRRWDEQEHVVAADPNDDWAWEVELARHPDWREQLIDPRREETLYWGDVPANLRAIDIWIGDQADLGKGWGTSIMSAVIERCFADASVSAVLIDPLASNVRAQRFYERMGFRFVQRRRFGADDCFVYRLTQNDTQKR